MRQVIYVFLIFLIVACQEIQSVEKPANFIEKERMQEIIYDIAIVNGARGYNLQTLSKYGVNPETYIFNKHSIDSLQFAENIAYYSSDIEEYKEMYEEIQDRVEGEFTYYDSIAKAEKKIKDSIRAERAKQLKREKDSLKAIGKDKVKNTKERKKLKVSLPIKQVKEIVIDSL